MADPQAHSDLVDSASKSNKAPDLELGHQAQLIDTSNGSKNKKQKVGHQEVEPVTDDDSVCFAFREAVLLNQVFLQSLTAQEILATKCVSKSWITWFPNNLGSTIAHARRHDESRDWFFPLFVKDEGRLKLEFSGMWHATAEFASESKLLKLPGPMDYLERTFFPCTCIPLQGAQDWASVRLAESSGGLLLFGIGSDISSNHSIGCPTLQLKGNTRLIITNSLTKQFKILPQFEEGRRNRSYRFPRYFIMVDDTSSTYKLISFWYSQQFPAVVDRIVVYNSRSNNWRIRPLLQPTLESSWIHGSHRHAVACMRGRLYLAHIRAANLAEVRGVLELFEVDIETGRWKLCSEFPLGKVYFPPRRVAEDEFLNNDNLKLVECMGHLYALIPARRDEFLYEPNKDRVRIGEDVDATYMALKFYVFQLEGEDGAEGHMHGVLRIKAPIEEHALFQRRCFARPSCNSAFAGATAKGSVIWVMIHNYVIQYNVLSGQCKTERLNKPADLQRINKPEGQLTRGLVYRASFNMIP